PETPPRRARGIVRAKACSSGESCVDQPLRGHQVCGLEALAELAMDRSEQIESVRAIRIAPQARQADRTAQLPGERSGSLRGVEPLLEARLGERRPTRTRIPPEQLALHPQQLRPAPALLALLRAQQRLFDGGDALFGSPGSTERIRQRGTQQEIS